MWHKALSDGPSGIRILTARNIVGGSSCSLTYDAVGNLTDNGVDQEYVYDVLGRMVQVKNQSSALISQHRYTGLGYRIGRQYDLNTNGKVQTSNSSADRWLYFIYDSSWRAVASVFAVDNGAGTESGEYLAKADDDPRELFVFHTAGVEGAKHIRRSNMRAEYESQVMIWAPQSDCAAMGGCPRDHSEKRDATTRLPTQPVVPRGAGAGIRSVHHDGDHPIHRSDPDRDAGRSDQGRSEDLGR